jgi:hypothetical protein
MCGRLDAHGHVGKAHSTDGCCMCAGKPCGSGSKKGFRSRDGLTFAANAAVDHALLVGWAAGPVASIGHLSDIQEEAGVALEPRQGTCVGVIGTA